MADLRRVSPGEQFDIPAESYNGFCDAADFVRNQRSQKDGSGGGLLDGCILVRNDTGNYVPRFGILQLTSPVFEPNDGRKEFQNRPSAKGILPSLPNGIGQFAVAQEPIIDGRLGQCKIVGLTAVKLKMYPDGDNPEQVGDWGWADIEDGEVGNLIVHPAGSAAIVWRAEEDDDEGLRDALVNLAFKQNHALVSGVANGACALNATCKCTPLSPLGAPDVDYVNHLGNIEDGSTIEISWEREEKHFDLIAATCTPE